MTRLALGAKCGRPGRADVLAVSSAFRIDASAATPIPDDARPKNCRRFVSRHDSSRIRFIVVSAFCDGFIKVK